MSGMGARVCAKESATRTELDEDRCESSEMHISYAAIVSQIEERWKKAGNTGIMSVDDKGRGK